MTSFSRAAIALGLTLLACCPASAQFRPERPYRGIFASGTDNAQQSLTAQATISGGYDDNILADATRRNTIRNARSGGLGQFSGGLSYSLNGERGSINSGVGTSIRYYPSLPNDYYRTYNASIGGQVMVLKKPQLAVYASANYLPYSFLSLAPQDGNIVAPTIGASAPPEVDFVPVSSQYVNYTAGSSLDQQLSRRTTLSLTYAFSAADRLARQFWRQGGGATLQFGLTRDLSLRTGYKYTEGHYSDGRTTQIHRPDIGLDFLHALSLTRRTTFSFGVGSEATVVNDETRLRATGNVNLDHEIGRSWTLSGAYRRGTYFVDTLPDPVFGDAAQASLAGLITRRLQFQANAIASLGRLGSSTRRNYDIYRGSISLSTALTRFINVGVDYAYFDYRFDEAVVLDPGVPRDVARQSIRGHVSLWAPLMNRARRTNATR